MALLPPIQTTNFFFPSGHSRFKICSLTKNCFPRPGGLKFENFGFHREKWLTFFQCDIQSVLACNSFISFGSFLFGPKEQGKVLYLECTQRWPLNAFLKKRVSMQCECHDQRMGFMLMKNGKLVI